MINTDKNHKHIYNVQGKQLCCTQEEKIYTNAGAKELIKEKHQHDHSDDDGHDRGRPHVPPERRLQKQHRTARTLWPVRQEARHERRCAADEEDRAEHDAETARGLEALTVPHP